MRDAAADLRAAFDRERRATEGRTGSDLVARARRARRKRVAATATLALVAVGGIGGGAWAAAAAILKPDVVTLGYATLPFTDAGAVEPLLDPAVASCGAPAPDSRATDDTLTLAEQQWSEPGPGFDDVDAASFRASITAEDPSPLPLTLYPTAYVFAQDGVVVGWSGNSLDPTAAEFRTARAGLPIAVAGDVFSADEHCEDGVPVDGNLATGDYEVYPVVRLLASPEAAARVLLSRDGYAVPAAGQGDSSLLVAGSWDCRPPQAADETGLNALCATDPIEGVTVDRDGETITVPYDTSVYARDVDVTLVGEPTAFSVRSFPLARFVRERFVPDIPSSADQMRCAALLREEPGDTELVGAAYPIEAVAIRSLSRATLQDGSTVDVAILPSDDAATSVAYSEPLRVWLVGWTGIPAGRGRLASIRQVVATATATIEEGQQIPLHRFVGASRATLTLTDLQWCPVGATGELGAIVVAGPETVTSDGDTATTDRFTTWEVGPTAYGRLTGS